MSELLHHVAAFYRFVPLAEVDRLRAFVEDTAKQHQLSGSVLVAPEGINGTVTARTRESLESFFRTLGAERAFGAISVKWSTGERTPFDRLRVKRKNEIVPLGRREIDPNRRVGTYVRPEAWNELLDDPELVLIDARNVFEVRLGRFDKAIDPGTRDFRELAGWMEQNLEPTRDRKVAMYCTGGIRCEKATSFLLERGFERVYHLEGGILSYLERVPEAETRFRGACFVFDGRVSLEHGLREGDHEVCRACGEPFQTGDRCFNC